MKTNKPLIEFSTTHGPKSHYARDAGGARMTQSFPTEIDLVQHLKERWNIDLRNYTYSTETEVPNAVFTHHWLLKAGTPLEQYARRLDSIDWLVFATHASPAAMTEIKKHLNAALELVQIEEEKREGKYARTEDF